MPGEPTSSPRKRWAFWAWTIATLIIGYVAHDLFGPVISQRIAARLDKPALHLDCSIDVRLGPTKTSSGIAMPRDVLFLLPDGAQQVDINPDIATYTPNKTIYQIHRMFWNCTIENESASTATDVNLTFHPTFQNLSLQFADTYEAPLHIESILPYKEHYFAIDNATAMQAMIPSPLPPDIRGGTLTVSNNAMALCKRPVIGTPLSDHPERPWATWYFHGQGRASNGKLTIKFPSPYPSERL